MAVNQASNDRELKQMLKLPLRDAVKILMRRILDLNNETINKVVYHAEGRPEKPHYYKNTYEFLDAWDIAVHDSKAIKTSDIQGSFFYKPSKMDSIPPCAENNYMGQHYGVGANITGSMSDANFGKFYGDSRDYLADIIYEGLSSDIYGTGYWTRKRNAYKELVKIIGKAKFKKWFAEAMRDVGLTVKSHGTAIKRTEF